MLTRSKPLQRRTGLTRTAFARKSKSPFSSLANAATTVRRTEKKHRAKKPTVADGSKYLAACRDQPCYVNVLCGRSEWADPTVVPCHDNRLSSGKGMGLKARNDRTLPGCMHCHQWLDQGPAPREEKFAAFDRGFARWAPVRARKMGIEYQPVEATP